MAANPIRLPAARYYVPTAVGSRFNFNFLPVFIMASLSGKLSSAEDEPGLDSISAHQV